MLPVQIVLINKTLHTEIDPRNKGMALPNIVVARGGRSDFCRQNYIT
jgi:hypothetical protein